LQALFDIAGDLDTPVSAFMKLAAFAPRFLLESVEGGERLGRYSFIGFGDAPRPDSPRAAQAARGELLYAQAPRSPHPRASRTPVPARDWTGLRRRLRRCAPLERLPLRAGRASDVPTTGAALLGGLII
jgi:anthranilate/para-aminobenzoate synthase component I